MSDISGNKHRLLIVDDSKVIRVTARKILQNHFETVEAVDGNNAWDILTSQEPFTLIVSDLTMPNLDGFGLLEKIRGSHLPHLCDIPVIIITGANDSEATMQRATAAGATDFIGKPFDSVHLLARTQAHASSYTATSALTEENIALGDQSLVDPLTGLANDTAFLDQGSAHLAYAIRHDTTLALASLEIDDFGELVRQHDDEAAELVIKSVGSALAANIRQEDLAARTGKARFALLLPGMDVSGVSMLSERISGDIGKHAVIVGGKRVRFTVSIGIATPEIRPDTEFSDLLAAAGDCLKQAIARGGNLVIPGEEMRIAAEPDREWTAQPPASAPASGTDQDESLADIEYLQIDSPDTLDVLCTEEAQEAGEYALAEEPAQTEPGEHTAATRHDAPLTMESVADTFEETIVITSPYSLFDLDEVEIADSTEEPDDQAETDSAAMSVTQPPQAADIPRTPAATDDKIASGEAAAMQSRPGVIRRLLSALFGRRY
jgi:diguanylate cyclase (GGDEF)-like protein